MYIGHGSERLGHFIQWQTSRKMPFLTVKKGQISHSLTKKSANHSNDIHIVAKFAMSLIHNLTTFLS